MMTRNPYKIVQLKDGRYAVEYKNYPHVGIPDSWGTKAHATAYMAALLGLVNIDIERQKKLIQKAMKKGMEDKEDGVR